MAKHFASPHFHIFFFYFLLLLKVRSVNGLMGFCFFFLPPFPSLLSFSIRLISSGEITDSTNKTYHLRENFLSNNGNELLGFYTGIYL
ncbi:hypothetical protein F4804DRAFT_24876 [Jackrogersella minutella]|nr:hypothetical protein F4804DRAFT_24876 [Jackrogersella minutella]